MKTILCYFNGGDDLVYIDKSELKQQKKYAKENGHVCYLSGYKRDGNDTRTVYVFMKYIPTPSEVLIRKNNGFLGIKLNRI